MFCVEMQDCSAFIILPFEAAKSCSCGIVCHIRLEKKVRSKKNTRAIMEVELVFRKGVLTRLSSSGGNLVWN